jgi:hypothetical protein
MAMQPTFQDLGSKTRGQSRVGRRNQTQRSICREIPSGRCVRNHVVGGPRLGPFPVEDRKSNVVIDVVSGRERTPRFMWISLSLSLSLHIFNENFQLTGKTRGMPPLTAFDPSTLAASLIHRFSCRPPSDFQLTSVAPNNKTSQLSPVGSVAITRSDDGEIST